jgi:hypothetical protein
MECKTYSDKSFAVYGETKEYKEILKSFGGKWNSNLKDGAGWIFPNSKRSPVDKWLKSLKKEGEENDEELSVNITDANESDSEHSSDLETVTLGRKKDGSLDQIKIKKCFMVTGMQTKDYKDSLKDLGGSWSSNLKGWIFPESKRDTVCNWIWNRPLDDTGSVNSSDTKVSIATEDEEPVNIADYSEKSILVSGGTKRYKEELKTLGGKWNTSLKGWIFPKTLKEKVEKWLAEK